MGLKKKKNIIILTLLVVISFILYQLYFFLAITSEVANINKVLQFVDNSNLNTEKHIKSQEDKYINDNGVIRGVLLTNMPRFKPNAQYEFKCLKSGQYIPYEQLNDDFCDCDDFTDEPSTNACVEGIFYCDTQYLNKPIFLNYIPSSMVNDGICDCCDGSDEWLHPPDTQLLTQGTLNLKRHYAVECPNICYN